MEDHPDKPKPDKQPDKRKVRRTGQRTKVGKDKWLLRVPLGKVDGRRRTHTETFHGLANQAEDRIREVLRRHRSGEPISVSKDSFGAFLDEWLEAKRQSVGESSIKAYTLRIDLYIRPRLGKLLIGQVTAEEIQRLYGKLLDEKISPMMIRHVHDLLNMVFKLAVLRRKLSGSPMAGVVPPKLEDRKAAAMSIEQVQAFLDGARGNRSENLFRLAFHVGCRPGELLALKWDDLNVKSQTIRIDQTIIFRKSGDWYLKPPKTRYGRRVIPLTEGLVEILHQQQTIQQEMKSKTRSGWTNHGFIFTKENGEPFAQWNLRDDCKAILDKAGLPDHFNPYTARHTAATLLMVAGQHPKLVSEQLGHSRISITLDTYTHPGEEMRAGLTAEIERILEVGNTQDTRGKAESG